MPTIDSRNAGAKTAGATSISWTHTVASDANFILVGANTGAGVPVVVSSVVWDSGGANVALSKTINGVSTETQDLNNNLKTSMWWLAAPSPGAKTILVTAASSCEIEAGSESLKQCSGAFNAASPQITTRSSGVNPTTTVTSAVGEWVVDTVGSNLAIAGTATVGASQNEIWNQNVGGATSIGCGSDEPGAATVTMDWTGLSGVVNATTQICVSLLPLLAGAAPRRQGRPFPFKPSGPRR